MGMRLRHTLDLKLRCLGTLASYRGREVGQAAAGQKENLWTEFFSQWLDSRPEKVNVRYPDFKHKKTGDALWVVDNQNPPWVGARLAAMAPGAVQLDRFSWNRRLARYVKAGQHEKT